MNACRTKDYTSNEANIASYHRQPKYRLFTRENFLIFYYLRPLKSPLEKGVWGIDQIFNELLKNLLHVNEDGVSLKTQII